MILRNKANKYFSFSNSNLAGMLNVGSERCAVLCCSRNMHSRLNSVRISPRHRSNAQFSSRAMAIVVLGLLAMICFPDASSAETSQLGPLFLERKAIPFSVLQYSFRRFSPVQAEIAYAESLAATEYLRDRYGMYEVRRMLQSIGSGVEPETALTNSTGMDYVRLAERIGEQMSKQ